ncbi:phytoene desaturase family protein [Deinococcus humi]|uniref:Phytoene dehydrogenase-like protein n=1 Tax=Deinococcus humi TaxID=662880 RepID=A0A7W8NF00_9DEIO|nr:NAD(P)/FAD-dependent oxidoreductase [Deinococcus humi]MBB5363195.1 phytoene dehydrogenase-like protein [Deinococcus humi]GGO27734.1 P49 secreted protein [Deinococcus humi]
MTVDAVIVGAGQGGLSAALTLARAGLRVQVLEAHETVGGGMRSLPLTLPGFVHDYGSAIHPLTAASPAFRKWPLHAFGLDWVHPDAPVTHPLGRGSVTLERNLEATADALGVDGATWTALMRPLLNDWEGLLHDILRPLPRVPSHFFTLARFGIRGLPPAQGLGKLLFRTPQARALWGGLAAHSVLPFSAPGTSAMTLVLALLAHAVGWPFPRGGAQAIPDAMRAYLEFLGGEVITGVHVTSAADLPPARVTLVDSSPAVLLDLLGDRAPNSYRAALKSYRYGPGIQKLDYALGGPVPWTDPRVARGATVHLGGTLDEVARSEAAAPTHVAERPYVLAAQHTLFDASRAPIGQHTFWAYSHVPNGSDEDIGRRMEEQIERYAPGFGDLVLARHRTTAPMLQSYSPVFGGGDVNGGKGDLWGLLARPVLGSTPYRTPVRGFYLCSSSTPPGGGIHGMAGYHAALAALKDEFGIQDSED